MYESNFQPLSSYVKYPVDEMNQRAISFRMDMQCRRTVRHFSGRPIPHEVIEQCLLAASLHLFKENKIHIESLNCFVHVMLYSF